MLRVARYVLSEGAAWEKLIVLFILLCIWTATHNSQPVAFSDHPTSGRWLLVDRRLLLAMIEKFDDGPVGVDSLAASISEERGTIEDVLEPYLIQQGFMLRSPRGRMVTRNAYLHFGLPAPSGGGGNDSSRLPLDLGEEGGS